MGKFCHHPILSINITYNIIAIWHSSSLPHLFVVPTNFIFVIVLSEKKMPSKKFQISEVLGIIWNMGKLGSVDMQKVHGLCVHRLHFDWLSSHQKLCVPQHLFTSQKTWMPLILMTIDFTVSHLDSIFIPLFVLFYFYFLLKMDAKDNNYMNVVL